MKWNKRLQKKTGDDPENAESLIRSTSPFFGQVLCEKNEEATL